ncbi:MAG: sigma-70 family RNA polymerase sigma factor [Planctomycetaceae bacterium]|jgi:RNA polymerase sigma factor (sigma-70 family)|nr:sigma-70 family RNA polymerase sigma factor [Planctomycetaceae bacterium]MDG2390778.1 sigma-70 family RNA polymerase sigma factor [Planctomycetaceae bacterium]
MGNSPDDDENEGAELLDRWKSGDESAAQEIFDQYLMRLTALARTRLSPKMARRVDPEDIVQSAYRSFFRGAADDRYTLEKSGDLWRLLAAIVMNKLHGQVEFHSAQKRSIKVEESMMSGGKDDNSRPMINPEVFVKAPSVTELLGMTEELEQVMTQLPEVHRRILELTLQGHDTSEIAVEIDRSERTVRRGLESARELLAERFQKSIEHE